MIRHTRALGGIGILGLALMACHVARPPEFGANGFEASSAGYHIRPLAGAQAGTVLPPVWQLDNFYLDPTTHAFAPKPAPEYRITYELDGDGDGITELREPAALYDLRFIHAQFQAALWVRAFPVARALQSLDLDVLLKDYVIEVSHVGAEAVRFDQRVNEEKPRYATHITRETVGKLAGLDAVDADVEVADREQLALNQTTSWRRMRLILARGPALHETRSGASFPVVIVLAYASFPEHFVDVQADFEDFLARFSVGQASGFVAVAWPHGWPIAPPLPNFAPPPNVSPPAASSP